MKLKILLTTNMIPSAEKPFGGIFVVNQFKYLQQHKEIGEITLFGIDRKFTNTFGSIVKYMSGFIRFIPRLFIRYDLVHIHFFYPFGLLGAAYRFFHPDTVIMATIHGTDVTKHIHSRRNRFIFSRAARTLDYLIAVGNDIGDEAAEKLKRKVDEVLSAGVDRNMFYQLPGTVKKYDFVFAGSFIPRKGVDILIEGIRASGLTKARFCFLGSGEFRNNIEELSKSFTVDLFINLSQEEMRRVFNESKFIILTSREEPFGLVITEAMYCGTPAIVAPIGGLTEQVQDGINGLLLKENTAGEIAKALQKAIEMDPVNYGEMATRALHSNGQHSLQAIGDRHVEIYRKLIRQKKQLNIPEENHS